MEILFVKSRPPYKWDPWINIAKLFNVSIEQAKRSTQDKSGFAALVHRVLPVQLHGGMPLDPLDTQALWAFRYMAVGHIFKIW